ncbi:putative Serine/threonine-protein kinase CTR1 [Paratrimastix pyriformis]|uniref:Serine/threonine-protein kinase CTR1 n=1 Tax=Paratrimastix pyriformis TaxID=342808 RepID=A0ABQ8UR81_9EUKA|nr:putative Serine/threonine-protein kinase CTR1 [Paratrimastix pyriformis]
MRWCHFAGFLLLSFFVSAAVSLDVICYTSISGADTGACTSQSAPCLSMNYALNIAGCTILNMIPSSTPFSLTQSVMIPTKPTGITLLSPISGKPTTIQCQGSFSALALLASSTSNLTSLTISNLRFTGCSAQSGAALLVVLQASSPKLVVTVSESIFDDNGASCGGGAIDLQAAPNTHGVELTLYNSTFRTNFVQVSNCPVGTQPLADALTGNSAWGGGAVRLLGLGSLLRIVQTTFSDNRVQAASDGATSAFGGAVMHFDYSRYGYAFTDRASFTANTLTCTKCAGNGGALALAGLNTAVLQTSLFTANHVRSSVNLLSSGGAVMLQSTTTALVNGSHFVDNQLEVGQGGNVAGGALAANVTGTMTVVDCGFDQNMINTTDAYPGRTMVGMGSALMVMGNSLTTVVTLAASNFSGNSLYMQQCNINVDGQGAAEVSLVHRVELDGCRFEGNIMEPSQILEGQFIGGALTAFRVAEVFIRGCLFDGNMLLPRSVGRAVFYGAALFVQENVMVSVTDSVFTLHEIGKKEIMEWLSNAMSNTPFAERTCCVQDETGRVPKVPKKYQKSTKKVPNGYQSVPECTKMYQLVPQQVPKFCTNRWWYFTKPVYQILVVYQSGPDAPPLQAGTSPKSLGTSPKSSWYFTKITKGTNHTCHMTTLEDQVRYQTALVPSGEAPLNSPWSSSVSEAARQYRRKGPKKYHSLYQNQLGTFLASTKKSTRKVPGRVPEKYQGEYQKSTKGGYQEYQTTRYKNFLNNAILATGQFITPQPAAVVSSCFFGTGMACAFSNLSLSRVRFEENRIEVAATYGRQSIGDMFNWDVTGGAGLGSFNADVHASEVTFIGNRVTGRTTLTIGGALVLQSADQVHIDRASFQDNSIAMTADLSGTGSLHGGAAFLVSVADLVLSNTEFVRSAINASEVSEAQGGGLYIEDVPRFNMTRCTFEGNAIYAYGAKIVGGALYLASAESEVRWNPVDDDSETGDVIDWLAVFSACQFHGNSIDSASSELCTGSGVYLRLGNFTGSHLNFTGQRTRCGGGASRGGSLFLLADEGMLLSDSEFRGVDLDWRATEGGCLFLQGAQNSTTFRMVDDTLKGCFADRGGAVGASVSGGGVALSSASAVLVETKCIDCYSATDGGALTTNGDVTLINCLLAENAARFGGAIAAISLEGDTKAVVNITGGQATGNVAEDGLGGVLYTVGGQLTLSGVQFERNLAQDGAAVFLVASEATVAQCRFLKNEGNSTGSLRIVNSPGASLTDCEFAYNTGTIGAAMYSTDSQVDLTRVSFHGNDAQTGGAYVMLSGVVSITQCAFSNNSAQSGGAIYASSTARLRVLNTEFTANVASYQGGAILSRADADVALAGCTLSGNTASESGSALALHDGAQWLVESTLFTQNIALLDNSYVGVISADSVGVPSKLTLGNGARIINNTGCGLSLGTAGSLNLLAGAYLAHNSEAFLGTKYSPDPSQFRNCNLYLTPYSVFTVENATASLWADGAPPTWLYYKRIDNHPPLPAGWPVAGGNLPVFRGALKAALAKDQGASGAKKSVHFVVPHTTVEMYLVPEDFVSTQFQRCRFLWKSANGTGMSAMAELKFVSENIFQCVLPNDGAAGEYTVLVRSAVGPALCVGLEIWSACVYVQKSLCFSHQFLIPRVCFIISVIINNSVCCFHSNDQLAWADLGVLVIADDWSLLLYGGIGGLALLATAGIIVGLLLFLRWARLRKATSIELASWRETQVASVNFTALKILERIGHGAAGEVFRGDLRGTVVAVKRLFATAESAAETAAFKREVSLLRTLRHPLRTNAKRASMVLLVSFPSNPHPQNIVGFIGATMEFPRIICTEYCARGSLFNVIHADIQLPYELRLQMAHDMACGLNYLHSLTPPIMHRDIKSQNMLVTDEFHVKVSDFGISRLTQCQDQGLTTAGAGTPAYSAPEALRGERIWLPADVFSFGVCLWELVTRQVPWADEPVIRLMTIVAGGSRLPIPADCPPLFARLIVGCWAQDPAQRPTMQQIVDLLGPEAEQHPVGLKLSSNRHVSSSSSSLATQQRKAHKTSKRTKESELEPIGAPPTAATSARGVTTPPSSPPGSPPPSPSGNMAGNPLLQTGQGALMSRL